jgi:bifunctional polynucleotide phosphatase/kinase
MADYTFMEEWKHLGCILTLRTKDFQFHSNVIITEFEDCLIKKLPSSKLYHSISPKDIEPYNLDFVKKIVVDAKDKSIIIMSNQFTGGKILIDALKRKVESFIAIYKIPLLVLFALKKNRFMKPHTGLWDLLKGYYKSFGGCNIQKTLVVSNLGGRCIQKIETDSKTTVKTIVDKEDTDRAFAHNCEIAYATIKEYINPLIKQEPFIWNKHIIEPEKRRKYIEMIAEYKNPDIFKILSTYDKAETFMIMIFGAPRSGKTTYAKHIINHWNKYPISKTNEVKLLSDSEMKKGKILSSADKLLKDRFSVIVDGKMHTAKFREPYEEVAKKYNTQIIYVEVNPGILFAQLFNHVHIQNAKNENDVLYSELEYYVYKSELSKPENCINYCPVINDSIELTMFRY